jgi:hypothetical protein
VLGGERLPDQVAVPARAVQTGEDGLRAQAAGRHEGVEATACRGLGAGADDVATAFGQRGHLDDQVGDDIAGQHESAVHRRTS